MQRHQNCGGGKGDQLNEYSYHDAFYRPHRTHTHLASTENCCLTKIWWAICSYQEELNAFRLLLADVSVSVFSKEMRVIHIPPPP